MEAFSSRDEVATTAMNAPSRSDEANARISSVIFPAFAHSCTASVASREITCSLAPVSSRPPILGSPTFPAPTTRQRLPSSFINIGNKLLTIPPIRFNLLRCSVPGLQVDRGRPLPRTPLPENFGALCRCDEQKTGGDFLRGRHRPDTGAADARLLRGLRLRRSDTPPGARWIDAGLPRRPGRSSKRLPFCRRP